MADLKKTDRPRLEVLEEAVSSIVGLSHEGLSKISAVVRLSLLALETPHGCNDPEMIAQALLAIEYMVADLEGQIECEAGSAGGSAVSQLCSPAFIARYKAQEAAKGANHG